MSLQAPPQVDPRGSRLAKHPWRALLVMLAIQPVCYALVGLVLYGIFRLPRDLSNMESLSTAALFSVGGFLAYVIVPFFLRIPRGRRTFSEYLDDIRLTRTRPFVRLLILTLSCSLILILCQGTGSLVYRLTEGKSLTWEFVRRVFDLAAALPPRSMLLFAQFFSGFEEVAYWLSNVFQAPLTAYWHTAPPAVGALYGVVFGYGLATLLLLPWVRFFCARWLRGRSLAASVS